MISVTLKEWDKGSLKELIVLLLRRRDSLKNGDDNLKFGLEVFGFRLPCMKGGTSRNVSVKWE